MKIKKKDLKAWIDQTFILVNDDNLKRLSIPTKKIWIAIIFVLIFIPIFILFCEFILAYSIYVLILEIIFALLFLGALYGFYKLLFFPKILKKYLKANYEPFGPDDYQKIVKILKRYKMEKYFKEDWFTHQKQIKNK